MRLTALTVTLYLAQGAVSGPFLDAPIWYVFAADRFDRTDGATALYESARRQAVRPARAAAGS